MGNYCSSCHVGESLAVKLCEDCAEEHRNNWPHGKRESFLGLGSEPIPYSGAHSLPEGSARSKGGEGQGQDLEKDLQPGIDSCCMLWACEMHGASH